MSETVRAHKAVRIVLSFAALWLLLTAILGLPFCLLDGELKGVKPVSLLLAVLCSITCWATLSRCCYIANPSSKFWCWSECLRSVLACEEPPNGKR